MIDNNNFLATVIQKSKKIFFSVSGMFSGKAESVTLLSFECRATVNLQNLINLVGAIIEKIEIL